MIPTPKQPLARTYCHINDSLYNCLISDFGVGAYPAESYIVLVLLANNRDISESPHYPWRPLQKVLSGRVAVRLHREDGRVVHGESMSLTGLEPFTDHVILRLAGSIVVSEPPSTPNNPDFHLN